MIRLTVVSLFLSIQAFAITSTEVKQSLTVIGTSYGSDIVATELLSMNLARRYESRWKTLQPSDLNLPHWLSGTMKAKMAQGQLYAHLASPKDKMALGSDYDLFYSPESRTWTLLMNIGGHQVFFRKKAPLLDGKENFIYFTDTQATTSQITAVVKTTDNQLQAVTASESDFGDHNQVLDHTPAIPLWILKAAESKVTRGRLLAHVTTHDSINNLTANYGLFFAAHTRTWTLLMKSQQSRVIFRKQGVLRREIQKSRSMALPETFLKEEQPFNSSTDVQAAMNQMVTVMSSSDTELHLTDSTESLQNNKEEESDEEFELLDLPTDTNLFQTEPSLYSKFRQALGLGTH